MQSAYASSPARHRPGCETLDTVYIGCLDESNGVQVRMHDCSVQRIESAEETEARMRKAAKYRFAVDQRDVVFDTAQVPRVRQGEIPKD